MKYTFRVIYPWTASFFFDIYCIQSSPLFSLCKEGTQWMYYRFEIQKIQKLCKFKSSIYKLGEIFSIHELQG